MDVIVRPDGLVDVEGDGLRAIEEWGSVFAQQNGRSVYAKVVYVTLHGVGTPVWILPRSCRSLFGVQRYSEVVATLS